jgi:succinate dehydrogenase / fumarate reductase flavoprotein subunit
MSNVVALTKKLLAINGKRTVNSFHKELGLIMWEKCGMARNEKGLRELLQQIPALREEFWKNVKVAGQNEELNQNLEHAGRVADFLEFGELLCLDALERRESCGGHFRTEFQTPDGEAKRDDDNFAYVAAWEYAGPGNRPILNKEPLVYEDVHMSTRSYK